MNDLKVCVILVTYNRRVYLDKLLDNLKKQIFKLSGIILINNNSTDDTIDFLMKEEIVSNSKKDKIIHTKFFDIDFYFYNSSVNTGGSGGFRKGFEIAYDLNYDYYWVMDDDVLPRIDCLKTLIDSFDEKHEVYVPKRIGEGFHDIIHEKYRFGNPFVHFCLHREVEPKNKNLEFYDVKAFTFEGPLLSKEIIKKVGLPNDKYFLQGDDYDYAFRCLKFSKIRYVNNAIIDRQIPLVIEDKCPLWRTYYSVRNVVLLDLRYCTNPVARFLRPIFFKYRWWYYCKVDKNPFRWDIVKKAVNDAICNRDGKNIIPGPMQGDEIKCKKY